VRTYYGTKSAWLTLPVYALEGYALDQSFFGCIPGSSSDCSGYYVAAVKHIVRFRLTTPDGEEHEFRQVEVVSPITSETWQCDSALQLEMDAGLRWRTHDGSQLELAFQGDNAVVTMPGGTRLLFPWKRLYNYTSDDCGTTARVYPVYRSMLGWTAASTMIDRN